MLEEKQTNWRKVLSLLDTPWKITLFSVVFSGIISTWITNIVSGQPMTGLIIGVLVSAVVAYPVGVIVITNLEKMDSQNQELQRLNAELEAYAHTLAHNMKNTVSVISLSSEIISSMSDDKTLVIKQAERIKKSSQDLTETINGLLLLASVREEDVPINMVNMKTAFSKAMARVDNYVADYQPQIQLPDTWGQAIGYEPWLVEVWVNYLSNAIKYGGTAAHISVGSNIQADGKTRFWISDNGRGLNQTEQQELFQKFSKVERVAGHGLGLSIVKQIIIQLDGTVGVESKGKRLGSTFYFTLPSQQNH